MLDFHLAASATETLLNNLDTESQIERFKTYTTIISLLDDIEKHAKNSGINGDYIDIHFLEFRVYMAHVVGLRKSRYTFEQNFQGCKEALQSLLTRLDSCKLDPQAKHTRAGD